MTTERQARIDQFRRSQPIQELRRKESKAWRPKGNIWTVEEIDLAKAEASRIQAVFARTLQRSVKVIDKGVL